jgi:SPP1 gp7 family putative phage head morphogenesis protein
MRVATYQPAHPVALEVHYTRQLQARVAKPLARALWASLAPVLARYRTPGEGQGHRHDATADEMKGAVHALPTEFYYAFDQARIVYARTVAIDEEAARLALSIQPKINAFNLAQQTKSLRTVGLDVTGGDLFLSHARDVFVHDNVALIESIPPQFLNHVAYDLNTAIQGGMRHEQLAVRMRKLIGDNLSPGVAETRAKLIARDQVSKYNGDLSKTRQQGAGVDRYQWSATGDRRTRPTHQAQDGNTYRWDEPTPIGIPGSEYQCRCVGLAVVG